MHIRFSQQYAFRHRVLPHTHPCEPSTPFKAVGVRLDLRDAQGAQRSGQNAFAWVSTTYKKLLKYEVPNSP